MSDIVERLRRNCPEILDSEVRMEAADEIERMRDGERAADAEIERLRIQVSNLRPALDSSVDLNAELKAEIERLRGALTQTSEAWSIGQNTIAQLRAAIEVRERDHREKTAEIERLRIANGQWERACDGYKDVIAAQDKIINNHEDK